MRKAEERWGAGIVEQLSLDLKDAFPEEKGFGASNLWYMKKWYLFYSQKEYVKKLQQLAGEFNDANNQTIIKLQQLVGESCSNDNQSTTKLQQLGAEICDDNEQDISFPLLFSFVPWGHHIQIITKCKDVNEALFYIRKTVNEGWSRATLMNCMKAELYKSQGKAVTNFTSTLPMPQAELAQEITKENYDFGFLTLPKKYDEEQLEDALCEQMARFLLELGKGFAFLGRQKELVVAGHSRRIDLLFYHIHLRCYIVVELKAVPFQPEFAGKLNFYVNSVQPSDEKF